MLKSFYFTLLSLGLLFISIDVRAGGMVISPAIITTGGSATIRSDNTDLGFGSGSTTFPHWIEQSSMSGTATFWTKIPVIYPGTTTIQMFYNGTPLVGSFSTVFTKDYDDTGLVGLWHLDEGTLTTANDSSGLGNTGTLVGAPIWQSTDGGHWNGKSDIKFNSGAALQFDGTNKYIEIPHNANQNNPQFTLSLWINLNSVSDDWGRMLEKGGYWGAGDYSLCWDSTSSKVRFELWDADINMTSIITDTNIIAGVWTFITATFNGTMGRLFINGKLQKEGTVTTPIGYSNLPIRIGAGSRSLANYFNGQIDEVRIYNRALSSDEIEAHYERRKYAIGTITVTYGAEQTNPGIIYPNLTKMRTITINNSGTTIVTNYQLRIPVRIGTVGSLVKD